MRQRAYDRCNLSREMDLVGRLGLEKETSAQKTGSNWNRWIRVKVKLLEAFVMDTCVVSTCNLSAAFRLDLSSCVHGSF